MTYGLVFIGTRNNTNAEAVHIGGHSGMFTFVHCQQSSFIGKGFITKSVAIQHTHMKQKQSEGVLIFVLFILAAVLFVLLVATALALCFVPGFEQWLLDLQAGFAVPAAAATETQHP